MKNNDKIKDVLLNKQRSKLSETKNEVYISLDLSNKSN